MSTAAHPPEVKAAVVADYVAGMTIMQVSNAHRIPESTVSRWVKAAGVSRPLARGRICAVDGCDGKHLAHGYCRRHYGRNILGHKPRGSWQPFRVEDRIEDCRWMAECGESLTGAARRIGISPNALDSWLRKHDPDTLRPLLERDRWPEESKATFHGVAS